VPKLMPGILPSIPIPFAAGAMIIFQ